MSGQIVDVGLGFNLPVNLDELGQGLLSTNPVTGFLATLVALFVFIAVIGVPLSSLLGAKLLPGILEHSRSFSDEVDVDSIINTITGNQPFSAFMQEPLDKFIDRVFGGSYVGVDGRRITTVSDVIGGTMELLEPIVLSLDYDDAFKAVKVPDTFCQHKLMCYVHSQISQFPNLLQLMYSIIGPRMRNYDKYSIAIRMGLGGKDCDKIYPECPLSVYQMASYLPVLKKPHAVKDEL